MDMQRLEHLEQKYGSKVLSVMGFLDYLEEKYSGNPVDVTVEPLPDDVVIPDKKYVESLIDYLATIKINCNLNYEFEQLKKGLKDIIKRNDFDDAEEIMANVHELMRKHIYGSDTKVSAQDFAKLEKYLEKAGYTAVSVSEGDLITPYKRMFERPIQARGGVPNTIKQIQLKPYTLRFFDGEQIHSELKLCGKCTYYK